MAGICKGFVLGDYGLLRVPCQPFFHVISCFFFRCANVIRFLERLFARAYGFFDGLNEGVQHLVICLDYRV